MLNKIVSKMLSKQHNKSVSIKWKLLFFNLSIIIFITIMTILLFMNVFTTFEKRSSEQTVQLMKQINDNIESLVNEMDNISISISNDERVKEMLENGDFHSDERISDFNESTQNLIKQLKDYRKIISDAIVVSKDMKIVSSTYYPWIGNYRLLGADWINKVWNAEGNKVLISGYQVSKEGRSYDTVVGMARSIIDKDRNIIGMTMIEVSLDYISRICNDAKLGKTGFIAVLDDQGYAIYNTNKSEIGSRLNIENIKKENGSDYYIANVNYEKTMIIYKTSEYTGMTVAGFLPMKEVLKEVLDLRNVIFIVETILFIIVILISIIISFHLSSPIIMMQNMMKSVEQGDFSISTEIKRNDEIGQLGRSFNIMVRKINELIDTVYKSQLREKEAELNELLAKINPHFLYNTLEVISMTAYLNNDNKVVEMLNALAHLFRYSTSSSKKIISIKREITHVDTYIYLQKIRNTNKFDFVWNVDEKIVEYGTIGFILQPIVENSIIHGFKDIESGGKIIVSIFEHSNKIVYRVEDNGKRMTEERLNEIQSRISVESRYDANAGIGLKNVDSRIKLSFGQEYGLNLWNDIDKGVTVEVVIPVIKPQTGGFIYD